VTAIIKKEKELNMLKLKSDEFPQARKHKSISPESLAAGGTSAAFKAFRGSAHLFEASLKSL
jgi:hypothetical protein